MCRARITLSKTIPFDYDKFMNKTMDFSISSTWNTMLDMANNVFAKKKTVERKSLENLLCETIRFLRLEYIKLQNNYLVANAPTIRI